MAQEGVCEDNKGNGTSDSWFLTRLKESSVTNKALLLIAMAGVYFSPMFSGYRFPEAFSMKSRPNLPFRPSK